MDVPGYRGVNLDPVVAGASDPAVAREPGPAAEPGSPRPERIDLTRYEQEHRPTPEDDQAEQERTGHYRSGPIDPGRPSAPRRLMRGGEQLGDMVGRRLLVGITFLDEVGTVTNTQQFCGRVLDVGDGVVIVERPGEVEPAVLPADVTAYHRAQSGRYTLRDTGEIVIDPDFVSTWQVAAVDG